MRLIHKAQAGTLESSDVMIMVEPIAENGGRVIELNSSVKMEYGESILSDINSVLDKLEVNDIKMIVTDKGALPATIKARTEAVIKRAFR